MKTRLRPYMMSLAATLLVIQAQAASPLAESAHGTPTLATPAHGTPQLEGLRLEADLPTQLETRAKPMQSPAQLTAQTQETSLLSTPAQKAALLTEQAQEVALLTAPTQEASPMHSQEAAARRPRKKRQAEKTQQKTGQESQGQEAKQESRPETAADRRRAPNPQRAQSRSGYMGYRVEPETGDTVYYSTLSPSWAFANGRNADDAQWRKYYRLVYNFNKVYPYALVGKKLEHIADSTIQARQMSRREKEKYVNGIQKELVGAFEKPLKNLTISQGALLIRLVDREVGDTGYDIIKDYKSGLAAGFWQGVAKMFSNNLKTHYDPDGEDRQTEELVQLWQSGQFPAFYYSIFFQYPRVTEVPEKYR